jgi:hypothetical protein
MARRIVFALACLLVLGGIVAWMVAPGAAGWVALVQGVIILAALAFERYRYKPELDAAPGPGWEQTGEKSVDGDSVVSVWFNPASGERAYVRERAARATDV